MMLMVFIGDQWSPLHNLFIRSLHHWLPWQNRLVRNA